MVIFVSVHNLCLNNIIIWILNYQVPENNFNEVSKRKIKYNINSTWNESSVLERQQVLFNQQNNIMKGQNDLIQLMYSNKSNWYWVISYIDAQFMFSRYLLQKTPFVWVRFKFSVLSLFYFLLYCFALRVLSYVYIVLDCMPVIHKESQLCS